MPNIIYLNGPSSVGKSTLAKCLQETLAEPYLHIGIDQWIDAMPAKMNNWEGGAASQGFSWKPAKDPTGHPSHQIQAGPFANKMTKTLKDIVLLLASQHYHLIIDDIAFGAIEVDEWKKVLKEYLVLYVGVNAPLEILEERERRREDRFFGSARGQYFQVHNNVVYDIEVDTHKHTLEENVKIIQQALKQKVESQAKHVHAKSNFAVMYRGYLKPGKEGEYQQAWQMVAQYFVEKRGAIGSCLHRTSDGMWVAYSRWPDQKIRDASWPGENAPSEELPFHIREAVKTLQNCLDKEKNLPDICMEVVNDLLLK